MFKEERKNQILDILNEREYASAQLLAKTLYVSLPTIRRDLSELSEEGLIKRSHGGAIAVDREKMSIPIEFRVNYSQKEKMFVAKKASEMVKSGDVIFIDPSSTVLDMLHFIKDTENLTIVTNSLRAVNFLADKKNIKLYLTGGNFIKSSMAFAGKRAERFVEDFNFDALFFSSAAVNEKGMVTDYSESETMFRKAVMKCARKKVFLCTGDKLYKDCVYNVCRLSEVDEVFCDRDIPKEMREHQ